MELILNHMRHRLIPIRQFWAEYHLPNTFGVTYFEPKDDTGLARIDGAGEALTLLRQTVLAGIPTPLHLTADFLDDYAHLFITTLRKVNPSIGLKEVEMEYAFGGFADMLNTWFYDHIRATQTQTPTTPFDSLYDEWVASSGRRSEKIHSYGDSWHIRLLNNAYGRVGLQVDMPTKTVYVHDTTYLCPAEGFMWVLLRDVIGKLEKLAI